MAALELHVESVSQFQKLLVDLAESSNAAGKQQNRKQGVR